MQCWRIHIQVKDYWEDYKNKKNDTTKDFSSDGMLQCRLCNCDVAFPSLFMPQAVPSRTTWRRPLMVRQP